MHGGVASPNQLAADAGARAYADGGNAVDAAVSAALVSMLTEPGVCALGAGGFVTLLLPSGEALTIDGYAEMPGRGLSSDRFGGGAIQARLAYGGGTDMTVGAGSVATPGGFAALERAVSEFGALPWAVVLEPVTEIARDGFPISPTSAHYLESAAEAVFGTDENGGPLLNPGGRPIRAGEMVAIPELATTLEALGSEGVGLLYRGELGATISEYILERGGILTRADLSNYQAIVRDPLEGDLRDWAIFTNPGPAIGGAAFLSMFLLMGDLPAGRWTSSDAEALVRSQEAVMTFRRSELDGKADPPAHELLRLAKGKKWAELAGSPSTIQTSAVDATSTACSITMSAGYGSGVMPTGTGMWLNNSLGELELNTSGYHGLPVGTRLTSNMAPTVARRTNGTTIALGSPGADRISTALQITLLGIVNGGLSLQEAMDHPRLHVELSDEGQRIALEPGMPLPDSIGDLRTFDSTDMFFGGASAVSLTPDGRIQAAADHRRSGATAVV
jgi:gamma-glutamyltranspeptidase/glutathione hydrolase